MAKINVRYFVKKRNRDGSARYYWQPSVALGAAGWAQIRLSDCEHDAIAQAEGINRAVDDWRAGTKKTPDRSLPGSVHALIEAYKKSRHFQKLADKTQSDYARYLETIRQWAGDTPAGAVSAKAVQTLYDTAREAKPRKAAYLMQVMRLLFNFAENESIIPKGSNPASRPRLEYKAAKGTLWSKAAVAHMVTVAEDMGFFGVGTAIMVNEWIGQRRGDILALPMSAIVNGEITLTQSKTGAEVEGLAIGEIPELLSRIEEQIKRNRARGKACGKTLIQQESGAAYTPDAFNKAFVQVRARAAVDMPECGTLIFKDLRHTAVTRLAESGAELAEIAAVTGHSFKTAQDIVDRYNVRTGKMARNALIKRKNATH